MIKMVLASKNAHKAEELRTLLSEYFDDIELLSEDDAGFTGEVNEDGKTFEENAEKKARALADFTGLTALGDDSGLSVDALGGRPGINSARYSGVCGKDRDRANNEKLLRELEGASDRGAEFVCCIACAFPKGSDASDFSVRGVTRGVILKAPEGKDGFGYDPLFFVPESGKTYAEMTAAEKNAASHRGKAVAAFAKKFRGA